ncbi:hypothetical protein U9R90_34020 [Streptomyces sp. E11-3]|uniref:hypothetical protein n=1 Tax=Streptomyces sp. E11-3 TaxID=3110112 RepID=UPI00397F1116
MNPIDIMATLAGYGLLGFAGLVIGLVCLIGLMLGGTTLVVHMVHRWRGVDGYEDEASGEDGASGDGQPTGLATFTWRE